MTSYTTEKHCKGHTELKVNTRNRTKGQDSNASNLFTIVLKLGLSPGGYIKKHLKIQIMLHWWLKALLKLVTISIGFTFEYDPLVFGPTKRSK